MNKIRNALLKLDLFLTEATTLEEAYKCSMERYSLKNTNKNKIKAIECKMLYESYKSYKSNLITLKENYISNLRQVLKKYKVNENLFLDTMVYEKDLSYLKQTYQLNEEQIFKIKAHFREIIGK